MPDFTSHVVTFNPIGNNNWSKNISIKITVNDDNGSYYLLVFASDNLGNITKQRSNIFNINNDNPTIDNISIDLNSITHNSFIITRQGNAEDLHSGLSPLPYIYETSTNGSNWITKCNNNDSTCNVTDLNELATYYYRLCA